MLTVTVILAGAALLFAILALAKASRALNEASDAERTARRQAANVESVLGAELAVLRGLFARQVEGETLTAEMVREGIPWRDIDTDEAKRLIAAGEVALLDVRTPEETSTGVLPGAQLLPMDEIEQRRGEVPTDRPLLVYCAGGGRSAAVCEFLAGEGHARLLNLAGGFGAWSGPTEQAGG
jgi:rhodanese-related sulfurtransferase